MLEALRTDDVELRRDAGELLVRAYRAPALAALTWRWSMEPADAEDLVQEFFATALEKRWFDRFDPAKGRFRTFLRMAVQRFAANAHQATGRLKRGGGLTSVPIDELEVIGGDGDTEAEARFRAAWVKSVFELALAALRAEAEAGGRALHLALFEAYDLVDHPDGTRPTYTQLGELHGLGDTQVINHLAWARRRFRSHVLEVLRRLAGGEQEFRDDVRDLLGIEPA